MFAQKKIIQWWDTNVDIVLGCLCVVAVTRTPRNDIQKVIKFVGVKSTCDQDLQNLRGYKVVEMGEARQKEKGSLDIIVHQARTAGAMRLRPRGQGVLSTTGALVGGTSILHDAQMSTWVSIIPIRITQMETL